MSHPNRRQAIGTISGGLAAFMLAVSPRDLLAAAREAARQLRETPAPPWRVLTAAQASTFDAFAARVIPSDDGTPGAREAGATRFLDNSLATFAKDRREQLAHALEALDGMAAKRGVSGVVAARPATSPFAAIDASAQDEIIREFEKSIPEAFDGLRTIVIAGTFSNPGYGGNRNKLGWKLLGFEDRFSWAPPFGYYDREVR